MVAGTKVPLFKEHFWHSQMKIRLWKKSHEAGQRPTNGRWFHLDYSLPHYQIGNWAIVFSSCFMINFTIVYIWPIYQSFDKRIWFTIFFFFLSQGGLHSVPNIDFILLNYDLFCANWSYQGHNCQNVPQVF